MQKAALFEHLNFQDKNEVTFVTNHFLLHNFKQKKSKWK